MNETGKSQVIGAKTVPSAHLSFRAWRKRTAFPTPALAEHAELVENDLRMMTKLDPVVNKDTVALCKDNIAAFAKAWGEHRGRA